MRTGKSWVAVMLTAAAVWTVSTRYNHAQSAGFAAGGTRVAVVDLVRAFNEFEQTKVVNDKMQEDRTRVALEADSKMQEIDADKAALNAFTPDSAEWYQRNKKLKAKMLNYRVWEELEKDRIGEEHLRWAKKTYAMVTDEIARVAKAQEVQLVVTREDVVANVKDANVLYQQMLNRKVVYSDPAIDLTDEVLANLNAAFLKAGGANSVRLGG